MPSNEKKVTGGEWSPECDCCGRQIEPGEYYFELDMMGDTILVCDLCKSEMDRNYAMVEDMEDHYKDFSEPDFHDERFW